METSAPGTFIGTFSVSNSADVWSYLLVDDAAGKFAIAGSNLVAGSSVTDFETAASHLIIVTASNGSDTLTRAFNIAVMDFLEVPVQTAPVNITTPAISGTPIRGQTLTAVPGTWDGDPVPDLSYVWKADGVAIPGAHNSTYVLAIAQDETTITLTETAANLIGSASEDSDGLGPVSSGIAATSPLYIRPASHGTADGSSWANAASLSSLDAIISSVGADGIIYLRADEGNYTVSTTLNLAHGGTAGHPVTIRGVDVSLANMEATLVGNRTDWTAPVDPEETTNVSAWTVGPQPFKLIAGANNLTWRYLHFDRMGGGCWRIAANLSNLTFDHCTFYNVQNFVESTFSSPATTASVTGLTITNCSGTGYSKQCVRIRYDSSDITISNCTFDSARQIWLDTSGNFASGIVFADTAHDAIITNVTCTNVHDTANGNDAAYWNGDGFAGELGNYGLELVDCVASGCTDGGFDFKSDITYTGCISDDNKYNWRIWGNSAYAFLNDATLTNCVSTDPNHRGGTGTKAHLQFTHAADVLLTNFHATDTDVDVLVYKNEDTNPPGSVLRVISSTISTLGTLSSLQQGSVILDASAADSTAPSITSSAAQSVAENAAYSATLTGTDAHAITWARMAGTGSEDYAKFVVTIAGGISMSAKDYEVPTDTNADNVYNCLIRCRDARRNTTYQNFQVTVTDVAGEAAVTARYIAPTGAGTQSGDGWANAAPLSSMDTMIRLAAVVPDAPVYVAAHLGNYTISSSANTVNISHGGTAGHPVVIQGVDADLTPTKPTFVGYRPAWTLPVDSETVTDIGSWSAGPTVFSLLAGANYLTFKSIYITRADKPFYMHDGIHDLYFYDTEFYNTREGYYMDSTATVYNLTIRRWKMTGWSKYAARFFGGSYNWLIEDIWLNSGRQDGDNFAGGIVGNKTSGLVSHDLTVNGTIVGGIYSGIIENCHDSEGGSTTAFWNSDCFAFERENYNIYLTDLILRGCTDAGVDSKSANTVCTRVVSYDNKENFKCWSYPDQSFANGGGFVMDSCTSQDPHKRGGGGAAINIECIGGNGVTAGGCDVLLKNSTVVSTGALTSAFGIDSGGNDYNMIIRECDNTYTNTVNNTPAGNQQIKLSGTVADAAPVITSSTYVNQYNDAPTMLLLTADRGATWAIVGGDDEALCSIRNGSGTVTQTGSYLYLPTQGYAGPAGDNTRSVTVRATGANRAYSEQTVVITMIAGNSPAVTVAGTAHSTSTFTSGAKTFTALATGTASAGRRVVAAIGHKQNVAITAVTIAGITASRQAAAAETNTTPDARAEIWSAWVPTGATADVSITAGSADSNAVNISLFALTGGQQEVAQLDVAGTAVQSSGSSAALSVALTVVAKTVQIAVVQNAGGQTTTWTGATEYIDEGTSRYATASVATAAAGTVTISETPSGSIQRAFAVASFK